MTTPRLSLLALFVAGCGARTSLDDLRIEVCSLAPPTCVRTAGDACAGPDSVAAVCNASTRTWQCPVGTRTRARAPAVSSCLPFHESVRALSGSLVRIPTDDGRCLWVAESIETASGELRNVAFAPDLSAPFGSCPARAAFAPETIVQVEDGDPNLLVQLTGAYRLAGATRVTYRLFRNDPSAPFGVTELGTGLGRWDAATNRVIVPGPRALRFAPDLDLGDASLVHGDYAYVWGCPGPPEFLTERCVVGRFDAAGAMELFAGGGRWVASTRGRDGEAVFDAGPWVSSVVHDRATGSLLHVYAVGFGSDLQTHVARAPEGPWTEAASIGRCELPAGDAKAFCAGPVVHSELLDPTHPAEWAISYGIGTTDGDARARGRPEDYWTRLAWLRH